MYTYGIIVVLIVIIYYMYIELICINNKLIYVFLKKDNIESQELEKEWCKVEQYLCEKKIKNKKIYIDDPIYTEWKINYDIKSIPEIYKIRDDGFRVKYNGKRLSENIIAWVFENK